MVLGTVKSGDASLLGKRCRIACAVALDGVDRFGDGLRGRTPSQPPTGHAPGLGKAMHHDRMLEMLWRKTGDTFVHGTVIEQMFVNLVAHDEHSLFHADIAQSFDFVRCINRASWVAR